MLASWLFIFSGLAAFIFATAAVFSEWHYRALPELPETTSMPLSSSVEVIIPARNEAQNIGRVVSSLAALDYPVFSIMVVDDHSTDDTAQRAQAVGAAVLSLDSGLPLGWTGKCNGCEQGARHSKADWLLFTDADTCHEPLSLACAVAYAESHRLDALSLLLRQECIGFWERLILPLAYQHYFAVLSPALPVFNGQYILIRRAIYEQSGGFGAVRGRIMEDVALSELLARGGYRIALLNGHRAASVRMYPDGHSLLRGMTKTAFAAARDRGVAGLLLAGVTTLGVLVSVMFAGGVILGVPAAILGGVVICVLNALGLLPWMRRFGVHPPLGYALLNPVGIAALWLIGVVSMFRVLSGAGVRWKDRIVVERR